MEWLVRAVVALAFMGGIAAVAHEAGYEVGVNSVNNPASVGSTVLVIDPVAPDTVSFPSHAMLPIESVDGSGTTYKTVPVAKAPVAIKIKHRPKKTRKVKTKPYQRSYNDLSAAELASLKAVSR